MAEEELIKERRARPPKTERLTMDGVRENAKKISNSAKDGNDRKENAAPVPQRQANPNHSRALHQAETSSSPRYHRTGKPTEGYFI